MAGEAAAEILARFEAEQAEAQQYVGYLCEHSAISTEEVLDLDRTLHTHGLPRPWPACGCRTPARPLAVAEVAELRAWIETALPAVEEEVRNQAGLFSAYADLDSARLLPREADELVPRIAMMLSARSLDEGSIAQVKHDVLEEIIRVHLDDSWTIDPRVAAEIATDRAARRVAEQNRALLRSAAEMMRRYRLFQGLGSHGSAINVHRQGFILLMTAFDAAIFDLARVALRNNFFALVGAFGKQDKISPYELGELGSWEKLRDKIMEEQLRKRYVKDLLQIIAGEWNVECVDKAVGEKFERLLELVLRRNVHVHNRGIVDERYLDERKNLDGLRVGDAAVIDRAYWEMANKLCGGCVRRVAAWAET